MLLDNLTRDEISGSIDELKKYKNFYEKKVQIDKEIMEKIFQRNKEYLMNILDRLKDLNSYEENILLLNDNIDLLEDIQKKVKEKKEILEISKDNSCKITTEHQNNQESNTELKEKLDKYNSQYAVIKANYNEHVINEKNITMNSLDEQETENDEDSNSEILPDEIKDNNILLISEIQNKVILPYKNEELTRILNSDEKVYKNLQEIIDEKYTVPLVNYKNASISRFREAFVLMRKKEKSSFMDAIDLALELMRNRFLHPAIITACKNLDQLDVYLDCLDTNELEDFPFFEIKYELYPVKVKTNELKYLK